MKAYSNKFKNTPFNPYHYVLTTLQLHDPYERTTLLGANTV
jgi:hypothetical protein